LVAHYIKDERLRQAFTFQPLLIGGSPFRAPSIYLLIHWVERKWGVHFAKGGTGAIVKGMVRLLDELGVEVRYDSPVQALEIHDGRAIAVRTEDGARIPCELVVSNADPSMVYTQMVAPQHRRRNTDRAIARKRHSMSLVVAHMGVKGSYPDLAHHTIIMGPRYKGLIEDIFDRKVLADDFSLYLHAPCRTDPSLAPEGHETFYVLSPVPNQLSGIAWHEQIERYTERIYDALDKRFIPGLKTKLVTSHTVDPRNFEFGLRSYAGAAFGLEPVLTQSAYFRYHNISEDIDGLYFVGASTHPGAGIPGVLNTAKVLENLLKRGEPKRSGLTSRRRRFARPSPLSR
jgi:phytoene desaturase